MATRKNDLFAESRKNLARFAEALVNAPPVRRTDLIDTIRTLAIPATLRLLAEALIDLLRKKPTSAGTGEVLIALGTEVLPALELAVLKKPSEGLVLRLAPVIVTLGRQLPERERVALQMTVGIAAGRAPTLKARVALDEVMWELRDRESVKREYDAPAGSGV